MKTLKRLFRAQRGNLLTGLALQTSLRAQRGNLLTELAIQTSLRAQRGNLLMGFGITSVIASAARQSLDDALAFLLISAQTT